MKRRRIPAVLLTICLLCQMMAYTAFAAVAEPVVQAQGAVVIDGATGQILYGKNANTSYYPASITKLMTALLVIEHCNLDETVTFSKTATTNLESGAVSLGMTEGDQLTVRQCLYALLLKSANEVGNALAEHVAGSVSAFADLMNQKAASLGCTGTHFTNPHGLNDTNHYTTPRDMALIARAAFQNATLREIDTTLSYKLPATKNYGARTITMGHKMMYETDSRYYEGIIGGKTGYTSKAGNTLVTGAERNGVRVIAVVMKANGTHYTDTKALLDYGFAKLGEANAASNSQSAAQQPAPADGTQTQDQQGPAVVPGETQAPGASGGQSQQQAPGADGSQSQQGPGAVQAPGTAGAPISEGPGAVQQMPGTDNGQPQQGPAAVPGEAQAPGASGGQSQQQAPGADSSQSQQQGPGTGVSQQQAPGADSSQSQQQAPGTGSGQASQTAAQNTGWQKDNNGWYYIKSDGTYAAGEWLNLSDGYYWIDSNGYMARGWRSFDNGNWYYFRSGGLMAVNRWVEDNGKWFYVGENGALLKNTTTPDGYTVGSDGAWIE